VKRSKERIVYLGDYPLKERMRMSRNYVYSEIDWETIRRTVYSGAMAVFDVSDAVEMFPHLELDADYDLICYVSKEYHGMHGRVAAIKKGDSSAPVKREESLLDREFGAFDLPESAVFPIEAMYNDGTSEGYLEAVLFQQMIRVLPYAHYQREMWDEIVSEYPEGFPTDWVVYADIGEWTPRAIWDDDENCSIMVCRMEIENGLGASDGRNRIYLTSYSFETELTFYYLQKRMKGKKDEYKGRMENDSRYSEKRRCCVHSQSSVLIAKVRSEKAYVW